MKKILLQIITLGGLFFWGCSPNNVSIDPTIEQELDSAGLTGTFGLLNNSTGQFTIYNLSRFKDSAYLPASTFKIVNSLIGIETGRIVDEKMVIPWDKKVRIMPGGDTAYGWNKDLTMEQAFRVSALPYFQEVARRIGKDTMQLWLDSLKYGNRLIGENVDAFWIDNSLTITADEQMGLIKKLYFGQLPFQKRTQEIVKKVMLQENNANYQLSYKTGLGFLKNNRLLGWVVGWIEENKHPYFFVLQLEGEHDAPITAVRIEILKKMLKKQGFFEGKM